MNVVRRRPRPVVSDGDRERVADLLGAHMVTGAISPEELAERTSVVLSAATPGELGRAVDGLPPLPRQPVYVRLLQRLALRTHVIAFAVVSAVLVVVWGVTREIPAGTEAAGFRVLWPFWVMLAWGVALVAHSLYALRQPLLLRTRGLRRNRKRQRGRFA